MPRPSGRSAILEAAEAVVVRNGAAHLTLDAVAEQAGLSKGGVLYHFPNKSALLEAMLERLLDGYEERRVETRDALPESPERDFQAEIRTGLNDPPGGEDKQVGAAMLAVLANEPALIERGREFHARRFERCCGKGVKSLPKATVLLALHGLVLMELLQVAPFTERERERIRKHLLSECERISAEP